MQVGIFARTFMRPTLDSTLDAVLAHGIRDVQFNMSCAGMPNMPEEVPPAARWEIKRAFERRGMRMAAVSGTFNIIHPDEERRRDGVRRLRALAAACRGMGTSVITISTGTRDPDDMWRAHPDNNTPGALTDSLEAMREVAAIGAEAGVTMAFEPEVSNVVDSADKARWVLDQVRSPHLRVVMDGANLFHAGQLARQADVLDEAFAQLGPDIALAHAKDLDRDGEAGGLPAGQGLLDYARYVRLLARVGYRGPLVLHGLAERDVAGCVAFLRRHLAAVQP